MSDGQLLIAYGPPGTGKTTYLAEQIEKAYQRYGTAVMASSFTKAAAVELVGRHLSIPKSNVGTLHALCYRALGVPPIAETRIKEFVEAHHGWALSGGSADAMDESAVDQHFANADDATMADYHRCRQRMLPREGWLEKTRYFAAQWEGWKKEAGYIDFTDMIENCLHDVDEAPCRPEVWYHDEAQDSSTLELTLIQKWAQRTRYTVLAGDDDQCLYNFRGSQAADILALSYADTKVLTQSYRVPRAVHALSQAWIKKVRQRAEKEYLPRDADGAVTTLSAATWKNVGDVVRLIEERVSGGKTIMILATCSYMLSPLIHALRERGIPYHNPYRTRRGDWNPLGHRADDAAEGGAVSSLARVLAFLRPDADTWGEDARFWTARDVQRWAPPLQSEQVWARGAKVKIAAWNGDFEVTVEDLLRWMVSEDAVSHAMDLDLEWYRQNLTKDYAGRMAYPLTVIAQHGAAAARNVPLCIVGTIHSVKGGQADCVVVFPDVSEQGYGEWMGSGRDNVRRQFYVAFTRAREELVLTNRASGYSVNWRER